MQQLEQQTKPVGKQCGLPLFSWRWFLLSFLISLVVGFAAFWGYRSHVLGSTDETVQLATKHLLARETAAVKQDLKTLLWFNPQHGNGLYLLGMAYHIEENWQSAIALFRRVPATNKFYAEAEFAIASTLIKDHQLDDAEQILQSHLLRYPNSHQAIDRLKWIYEKEVRHEEGLRLWRDQFRAQNDFMSKLPDLLRAETSRSNHRAAIPALEKIQKLRPGQPGIELALGECYWKTGELKKAEGYFQLALGAAPDRIRTRLIACDFYIEMNRIHEASDILQTPPSPAGLSRTEYQTQLGQQYRYWLLRSKISESQNALEESLDFLSRGLRLSPYNREMIVRKSKLLRKIGRVEEAQEVSAVATHLDSAANELFLISEKLTNRAPSIEECEKIVSLSRKLGKQELATSWGRLLEALKRGMTITPVQTHP